MNASGITFAKSSKQSEHMNKYLRRGSIGLLCGLVSDTNALLFTPMLAEVAGSSLEATHITSPLRFQTEDQEEKAA